MGDKVRVKYGVIDADFPDIPLGGWTGTVTEVEHARVLARTLDDLRPINRKLPQHGPGVLVRAMLGPERAEHTELDLVRLAVEQVNDAFVLVAGERELVEGALIGCHEVRVTGAPVEL